MYDCLLVETKITTIFTVILYKMKQCYTTLTDYILEVLKMSISLSVAQLCKHVLKISVEDFETKKNRGDYKRCNGAAVKSAVAKIWENLEKIFPSSEHIVKEKVSDTKMRNSVRTLMTAKSVSSVVLFTFTEERETRKGGKLNSSLDLNKETNIIMKFRYQY